MLAREALGGEGNFGSVEGCITRLRPSVEGPGKVYEARLKELGSSGVVRRGRTVQVVTGTQSDRIADRMNRTMKGEG